MLDELLAQARDDENVLGVVVHGSRGRGLHVHEGSDWDVIVVVRELAGRYGSEERGGELESFEVTSLTALPNWMLPAVTWTKPALDKTGEIAAQLAEITTVDQATAAEPLDGYIDPTTARPRTRAPVSSSRRCSTRRSRSRTTSTSSSPRTAVFGRTTSGSSGSHRSIRSRSHSTSRGSSGSRVPATSTNNERSSATPRPSRAAMATARRSTAGSPTSPGSVAGPSRRPAVARARSGCPRGRLPSRSGRSPSPPARRSECPRGAVA